MRDEEIAATAKDLEMKQLELESQKRHYEKVEASGRWEERCPSAPADCSSVVYIVHFIYS